MGPNESSNREWLKEWINHNVPGAGTTSSRVGKVWFFGLYIGFRRNLSGVTICFSSTQTQIINVDVRTRIAQNFSNLCGFGAHVWTSVFHRHSGISIVFYDLKSRAQAHSNLKFYDSNDLMLLVKKICLCPMIDTWDLGLCPRDLAISCVDDQIWCVFLRRKRYFFSFVSYLCPR